MENKKPILSVNQISKHVSHLSNQLSILQDITFHVYAKESVAIVGSSGSGKSTLLSIISGLDQASSGSINILDYDLSLLNEDQRAQVRLNNVGFVFQNFHLMPTMTALENVMLPLELAQKPHAKELASDILSKVGLAHRLHHYPKFLSGGEQQRVAIARAFVHQPKILFADEPTGSLDAQSAKSVIDLLFRLNREHDTVLVLVTHDMELANRCQRKLLLDQNGLHEQESV